MWTADGNNCNVYDLRSYALTNERPERDTNLYDSGAALYQLNYQLSYFFFYFYAYFTDSLRHFEITRKASGVQFGRKCRWFKNAAQSGRR